MNVLFNPFCVWIIQNKYFFFFFFFFFASNLSFSDHGHVGSLFANEEQKKDGS